MRNLSHIAARLYGPPWMIEAGKLEVIDGVFRDHLERHASLFDDEAEEKTEDAPAPKPYSVDPDGIATIRILGTTVRRATGMRAMSGMTSYTKLSSDFAAAVNDGDVKAIMLDFDSPGGEAGGCFDVADQIFAARGSKPIWACSNEMMFSAAYALGSSADKVYMSRTAGVGSIGVVAIHTEVSKALEQEGVKKTIVKFGARKADGNMVEPLSSEAQTAMQSEVDRIGEMFVATVARNRGISIASVLKTEAGVFYGPEAITAGLADKIGTHADAMNNLRAAIGVSGSDQPENDDEAGGPLEDGGSEDAPMVSALSPIARNRGNRDSLSRWEGKTDGSLLAFRRFGAAMLSSGTGPLKITGLPVPYNRLSGDLGGFREVYAPGCFSESLSSDDYRIMFDHDRKYVLGRKSAGTALLYEDAEGVKAEATPPDAQWVRDLLASMRRGDINQMSAAFYIVDKRWETRSGEKVRVVTKARMVECSVMTFPAYESTTAKVSESAAKAQVQQQNGHLRARLELLKLA